MTKTSKRRRKKELKRKSSGSPKNMTCIVTK